MFGGVANTMSSWFNKNFGFQDFPPHFIMEPRGIRKAVMREVAYAKPVNEEAKGEEGLVNTNNQPIIRPIPVRH